MGHPQAAKEPNLDHMPNTDTSSKRIIDLNVKCKPGNFNKKKLGNNLWDLWGRVFRWDTKSKSHSQDSRQTRASPAVRSSPHTCRVGRQEEGLPTGLVQDALKWGHSVPALRWDSLPGKSWASTFRTRWTTPGRTGDLACVPQKYSLRSHRDPHTDMQGKQPDGLRGVQDPPWHGHIPDTVGAGEEGDGHHGLGESPKMNTD